MSATLGVDVGGTFTDFFLVDEATGETRTHKVASTPDDPSRAILQGLRALVPEGGLALLAHGTTVATNALIQRRGGKVALVTTAGFKDLLEIGRQTRPKIYDLKADHPEPLVPRERRFEVAERIGPAGEVIRPLGEAEMARAVAEVKESGAESVAVCFLFSFLNPAHERRMGEALRAALPGVDVSLSCEVQPEFREYERLSTTVLNAFLQPVAGRYMSRLAAAVERARAGRRHRHLPVLGRADVGRPRRRDADPHRAVGARRGRRRRRGCRRARRPRRSHHVRHGRHLDGRLPGPRRQGGDGVRPQRRRLPGAAARRSISTPSALAAGRSPTSGATASCASGP